MSYIFLRRTVKAPNFDSGSKFRQGYLKILKNRSSLGIKASDVGQKRFMLEIIFRFQQKNLIGGSPLTL